MLAYAPLTPLLFALGMFGTYILMAIIVACIFSRFPWIKQHLYLIGISLLAIFTFILVVLCLIHGLFFA